MNAPDSTSPDPASLRLAVYGTLAPGRENAGQLAGLSGTWSEGFVRARRGSWGRYPTLTWDEAGERVPVWILRSDDLPQAYARLDRFEGSAYRRALVPVETAHGVLVCNLYVAAR
jgi:gamma-glutamylcyclotransferase (GGCT)/AIG2-like uncharacterized protein YtfP